MCGAWSGPYTRARAARENSGCWAGQRAASDILVVMGPGPSGNLAQRMKLIIALGVGVLPGNLRAEFNVGSDGLSELLIIGKISGVERSHVERDESLALLLGDPKVPMDSDQMLEAELPGEAVGAAEGFGREGREMIDVLRLAGTEERLQQGITEDTFVERLL